MNPCPLPGCPGYHVKFSTCLVEALYGVYATCVGTATEECGDVEWGTYAWLIIEPDTFKIRANEWDGHTDMTVAGPLYAILSTDNQGYVYLETFDTERAAQDAYDRHERAYALWAEENEE